MNAMNTATSSSRATPALNPTATLTPTPTLAKGAGQQSQASAEAPAERPTPQYQFNLSPMAARKLYENLRKRGTPEAALRVGVRGGGCSGFTYVLEFEDKPPRSRDLVFRYDVERKPPDEQEPGQVRVVCDKKSILYLNATTLDWEKTLMYQGFKFVNPQEKGSCGCRESFAV